MTKLIPLTKNQHAIVDDEDYAFLAQWKWCYQSAPNGRGYAVRREGKRSILMHRDLMKPPTGLTVDHINGNGLDCRKCNMRIATHAENMRNRQKQSEGFTSQYRGVYWEANKQRWRACVWLNKKRFCAGYHQSEEAAAKARDAKAVELHREFANLNFPKDETAATLAG